MEGDKTNVFIEKSKKIHGEQYSYSKANYISAKRKIIIVCKLHGEFLQTPTNHLSGKGCRKCFSLKARNKYGKSTKDFIQELKNIHGNKYGYDEVEYINAHSKIKVKCFKHGYFLVNAQSFKNGSNCAKCSRENRVSKYSNEEIINEFSKVHGKDYDYSVTNYKKYNQKIAIKCKKHGIFWQLPKSHMKGSGCPKCAGNEIYTTIEFLNELESRKFKRNYYDYSYVEYKSAKEDVRIYDKRTGTYHRCNAWTMLHKGSGTDIRNAEDKTAYALAKLRQVHGSRYDYTKLVYKSDEIKLLIGCKIHGFFKQRYSGHLRGKGCPICGDAEIGSKLVKQRREAIDDFVNTHGRRYDYSNVVYENSKNKVEIVCRKHGAFWQSPSSHVRGSGCPKCKQSTGENRISVYLTKRAIEYEVQKKFPGMELGNSLRCDFYLNTKNLVIEYNGRQHYQEVPLWGGKRQLKRTQELDQLKRNYCKMNGINYEVIRYDEDIYQKLEEILAKY